MATTILLLLGTSAFILLVTACTVIEQNRKLRKGLDEERKAHDERTAYLSGECNRLSGELSESQNELREFWTIKTMHGYDAMLDRLKREQSAYNDDSPTVPEILRKRCPGEGNTAIWSPE